MLGSYRNALRKDIYWQWRFGRARLLSKWWDMDYRYTYTSAGAKANAWRHTTQCQQWKWRTSVLWKQSHWRRQSCSIWRLLWQDQDTPRKICFRLFLFTLLVCDTEEMLPILLKASSWIHQFCRLCLDGELAWSQWCDSESDRASIYILTFSSTPLYSSRNSGSTRWSFDYSP